MYLFFIFYFKVKLLVNSLNEQKMNVTQNTIVNPSSTNRMSVFAITSLLICLYTLALVLAIVWIVWLYYRRVQAKRLKQMRHKSFNQTDLCSSFNTMN